MTEQGNGTEQKVNAVEYYLSQIRDEAERIVNDNRENNGNVLRILDAMRTLLNLEGEAMTMLRDIRRERDTEIMDRAEKEFSHLLYDLIKYTHSPDFLQSYVIRLDVSQLRKLGDTFETYLNLVIKETEQRLKALKETADLIAEDSKAVTL